MKHELKIQPKYLNDILNNGKNFEIRKDDRGFKVGDTIVLREYENGQYTGRSFAPNKPIQYILRDCEEYGLAKGYCIMSW